MNLVLKVNWNDQTKLSKCLNNYHCNCIGNCIHSQTNTFFLQLGMNYLTFVGVFHNQLYLVIWNYTIFLLSDQHEVNTIETSGKQSPSDLPYHLYHLLQGTLNEGPDPPQLGQPKVSQPSSVVRYYNYKFAQKWCLVRHSNQVLEG